LQQKSWISSVIPVETNIVVGILSDAIKRDEVIQLFANQNCKIMAFGPGMIRMVTHLDLSESAIEHVLNTIKNIEI
jgi:threonine aldolase